MSRARIATILMSGYLFVAGCGGNDLYYPPVQSSVIGQYIGIFNDGSDDNFNPIMAKNPPFDLWDITFIAFIHTYERNGVYVVDFENARGGGAPKPDDTDRDRISRLLTAATQKNPAMKFVVSLGFGNNDLVNAAKTPEAFADSVVRMLQDNGLDGFDIDYEEIFGLSDEAFRILITTIRNRLDQTGKKYLFTITSDNKSGADILKNNIGSINKVFDYVQAQGYNSWGTFPSVDDQLLAFGVSPSKLVVGTDIESGDPILDHVEYAQIHKAKGIFGWRVNGGKVFDNKFLPLREMYTLMKK